MKYYNNMKGRLQTALQKQTVTLSTWTWVFCFISILQTGYILFMNKDVAKTIPQWFVNRWQYYKVTGIKSLRKAVTVALCIVSITLALIAGMCIPLDINVVSWWICFSVGLNLMYHSCCNNNCY